MSLDHFVRRCTSFGIVLIIGSLFVLRCELGAEEPSSITPLSKAAIEKTIHDYILAHPEIIAESLRAMEIRRQEEDYKIRQENLVAHQEDLLNDKLSPVGGNPAGDVTVIEFFDYRCGFCKQVAGAVTQLQKDDKNVRILYRDFPILGDLSVLASKAALSAHRQGKHQVFHEALLASGDELTREVLFGIAARVGLDTERLGRDLQSADFDSVLDVNRTLARELGINGTPTFIINTTLRPGALNLGELKDLVSRARTP